MLPPSESPSQALVEKQDDAHPSTYPPATPQVAKSGVVGLAQQAAAQALAACAVTPQAVRWEQVTLVGKVAGRGFRHLERDRRGPRLGKAFRRHAQVEQGPLRNFYEKYLQPFSPSH